MSILIPIQIQILWATYTNKIQTKNCIHPRKIDVEDLHHVKIRIDDNDKKSNGENK